jgi:hypothetical protein
MSEGTKEVFLTLRFCGYVQVKPEEAKFYHTGQAADAACIDGREYLALPPAQRKFYGCENLRQLVNHPALEDPDNGYLVGGADTVVEITRYSDGARSMSRVPLADYEVPVTEEENKEDGPAEG